MAKRFTDTEKYKDPWFRRLTPKAKILFQFICDDCNHGGIWKENFETFKFYYNITVTHKTMKEFGDKVHRIDNDTYLIRSFIKFQYGKLNPSNKAHLGAIRALHYAGIPELDQMLTTKGPHSSLGIGTGEGNGTGEGSDKGNGEGTRGKKHPTVDDIPF